MVVLVVSTAVFGQQGEQQDTTEQLDTSTESAEELIFFDDSDAPQEPQLDAGADLATGGMMDLLRMLLMLVLVIAMIYGVIRLLKRIQQPIRPETSLIQLAASQALSSSRSLHLIQVGQQVFLVGEAETGVQLVSEITDQESLDEIRLRAPLEQSSGSSFAELLGGMFRSRSTTASETDTPDSPDSTPSFDFIQRRRDRLKDL